MACMSRACRVHFDLELLLSQVHLLGLNAGLLFQASQLIIQCRLSQNKEDDHRRAHHKFCSETLGFVPCSFPFCCAEAISQLASPGWRIPPCLHGSRVREPPFLSGRRFQRLFAQCLSEPLLAAPCVTRIHEYLCRLRLESCVTNQIKSAPQVGLSANLPAHVEFIQSEILQELCVCCFKLWKIIRALHQRCQLENMRKQLFGTGSCSSIKFAVPQSRLQLRIIHLKNIEKFCCKSNQDQRKMNTYNRAQGMNNRLNMLFNQELDNEAQYINSHPFSSINMSLV